MPQLPKAPTGIDSPDEITKGGLPLGRPTLVCGSARCVKTLMGLEFLVRGVLDYHEPGMLMVFEETAEELAGIVTGASRLTQQMQEYTEALAAQQEADRRDREVERRRMLEATVANLRTEFESVEEELHQISSNEQNRQQTMLSGHQRIAAANPSAPTAESGQ